MKPAVLLAGRVVAAVFAELLGLVWLAGLVLVMAGCLLRVGWSW